MIMSLLIHSMRYESVTSGYILPRVLNQSIVQLIFYHHLFFLYFVMLTLSMLGVR